MEIRVLNYFVETARLQNMTKAAQKLHVSQPTLSKQLKELEEELGQKLFNRSKHHSYLTAEGEILYKRATAILSIVRKTEAEFQSMVDFNGGDIFIGCAESYGIHIIAIVIKELRQTYPNIKFHLYSGNYDMVTERLNQGLIDFGITVQNIDTSSYNSLTLPYQDSWGLLMRKDSPLAEKVKVQISDLMNLPLIISRQGFTDEMPNELKEMSPSLNIIGTYNLAYNASIFVQEGLGYAICFDNLIHPNSSTNLTFKKIDPPILSSMKLIWTDPESLSRTAKLFLEQIESEVSRQ
ncbi:LysR family transcriptional regulator [Ignavigranum ruoffiae]|uniref:LysR family transcriptional regulator n=1 Tax=Ignavigranum ruoffiae TaxID=89093 RepID=UPI002055D04C|nr:LysR family transcriptional regulator [Ignavigranum ruoffiae]UPQ85121.1 LysR family transcriptional regulator [Ignavigranum ruoffiae]